MTLELPAPIADYFAADKGTDTHAISRHFTHDAIVRDEGRTYTGRHAIQEWKAASSAKYNFAVEPFDITEDVGVRVVTAHLTGDFFGSPVDLRYRFALEGDRIAGLEIAA